jgi:hypothetical protein
MKDLFQQFLTLLLVAILLVGLSGCATHHHVIGNGASTGAEGQPTPELLRAKQWYILFGSIPLNQVNTQKMAGGAEHYEIKTKITPLDGFLTVFFPLIHVRTVEVRK